MTTSASGTHRLKVGVIVDKYYVHPSALWKTTDGNHVAAYLASDVEETLDVMRAALMDAIEWADEYIPGDVYKRIKDAATREL